MALSIQNNIASLVAQGNLNKSSSALNTSLQRLSSGLKINSGADSPAGLVISNEQGAQIAGLQSAIDNTNQAVSMVQTGEGALSTVNDLLVQIRGLALSAANSAVNDPTALAADQAQIQNALQTIDRISANTQFGTKKLLDGSSGAAANIIAGGTNITSVTAGASTAAGTYQIAITQQGQAAQILGSTTSPAASNSSTFSNTGGALNVSGGLAPTTTSNTQVGTYNIAVTQQGVKGLASLTAANLAGGGTQALTISGGLFTGTVTANLTASESVANQIITIQAALDGGAGGFAGAYTVTASGSGYTIQSNVFGPNLQVVAGAVAGGTGGVAVGTVQDGGQVAKVAVTGGNLTSTLNLSATAGTAANTAGTQGDHFAVASGVANGLAFTLANGGTNTAPTAQPGQTATVTVSGSDSLTLNGTTINLNAQNGSTADLLVSTINGYSSTTNVTASKAASGALVLTSTHLGGGNFTVSETGGNIGVTSASAFAQQAQDLQAKIYDASGNQLGGTITGSGAAGNEIRAVSSGSTSFGNANGIDFKLGYNSTTSNGVTGTQSAAAVAAGAYTGAVTLTDGLQFQIGANANQTASLSLIKTSSDQLGQNVSGLTNLNTTSLAKIDVTTANGANDALKIIDQAINDISSLRGKLGAFQTNTLQATASNLQTTLTNTTAAQSVIRDTDFAAETANFTKAQVLVQAGTTVLTNANATAQLILNLLK